MKKVIALGLASSLLFGLVGCATETEVTATETVAGSGVYSAVVQMITSDTQVTDYLVDDQFSNKDYEVGCIDDDFVEITLSNSGSSYEGSGVTISGSTITITQEGAYLISGSLTEGQIVVDAGDDAKVQLSLDGVTLTNSTTAAIYGVGADKIFITTITGTTNTISSTIIETEDSNIDAAIFSHTDLTLNGEGSLVVNAVDGNGITSKDDLAITSGSYTLTVDGHGLEANNSIRVAGGTFAITSGKDGLHCDHDEDATLGYIYIAGGTFLIDAQGDGMDSSSSIEIENGTFFITTGGGYENYSDTGSSSSMSGMMSGMGNMPGMMSNMSGMSQTSQTSQTTEEDSDASTKAIKADLSIAIIDGEFIINSCDDALHSNGTLRIDGGVLDIQTGDDAIKGETVTAINGGTITITQCYEGIEGHSVMINGGEIYIYASDDGINSVSSAMVTDGSDVAIYITGGVLEIDANNEGDGFDSNGNIYMSGGTVIISGTTTTTDTSLDFNSVATITGGTFLAAGSTSQTRQNFGEDSTQGSIMVDLNSFQTGTITLTDSQGTVVAEFTPAKAYQTVHISSGDIVVGETYTLTAGTESHEIVMESLIWGTNVDSHNTMTQGNMSTGMTQGNMSSGMTQGNMMQGGMSGGMGGR